MFKKNWLKILISSLVTLSPIAFGLIMWNKLPETMATHWGVSGEADGFSSRTFAVFGIPLFLVALNILCMVITSFDKKNKNQNKKAFNIIFYIVPIISIFCSYIMYAGALGKITDVSVIMPLFLGLCLIIVGNILPKIRQNTTLGIKIKWTLESEENWNATHRFGGKVWVICGLLILPTAFLPDLLMLIAFFTILISSIIIITVYSYRFYKKTKHNIGE